MLGGFFSPPPARNQLASSQICNSLVKGPFCGNRSNKIYYERRCIPRTVARSAVLLYINHKSANLDISPRRPFRGYNNGIPRSRIAFYKNSWNCFHFPYTQLDGAPTSKFVHMNVVDLYTINQSR